MKLGLLTAPFPDTPLMEVVDWSAANGFESLEIACWPRSNGPGRPYAGTSHIDVANLSTGQAREIVDGIAARGLSISGLGYYPNPLHPEPAHRETVIGHLRRVIVARVWPDIVAFAGDHGVRIAIENCPMLSDPDEWPRGHNLATTPRIWRRILEAWGGTVGLNFDPSHLILQMIDIPRFVREFGPHILHVQAKDLTIDRDGLYERGILSGGVGWQHPRLPGLGEVDWGELFDALHRVGYNGDIVIEHEDHDFEGTDDLVKRGFLLARDFLRPYIT